jgi:SAM-dependent methyltransferase
VPAPADAETANCPCGSNIRTRALLYTLSEELFGAAMPLSDFPQVRSLRGLGTSDSPLYADRLADRFDYRNTFFHREPRFDIATVAQSEFGRYDFLLSSEVLEHVVAPVERAFENACRMLKPSGVFVFSVPYSLEATTKEHFPALHDFGFARLKHRTLLVNRTAAGDTQIFDDVIFHGGGGATAEMREFSESGLKALLTDAGFTGIRIDSEDHPEFGIVQRQAWSLPIAARKGPFAFSRDATRDLAAQFRDSQKRLQWLMSRWPVRLAVKLKVL